MSGENFLFLLNFDREQQVSSRIPFLIYMYMRKGFLFIRGNTRTLVIYIKKPFLIHFITRIKRETWRKCVWVSVFLGSLRMWVWIMRAQLSGGLSPDPILPVVGGEGKWRIRKYRRQPPRVGAELRMWKHECRGVEKLRTWHHILSHGSHTAHISKWSDFCMSCLSTSAPT